MIATVAIHGLLSFWPRASDSTSAKQVTASQVAAAMQYLNVIVALYALARRTASVTCPLGSKPRPINSASLWGASALESRALIATQYSNFLRTIPERRTKSSQICHWLVAFSQTLTYLGGTIERTNHGGQPVAHC